MIAGKVLSQKSLVDKIHILCNANQNVHHTSSVGCKKSYHTNPLKCVVSGSEHGSRGNGVLDKHISPHLKSWNKM